MDVYAVPERRYGTTESRPSVISARSKEMKVLKAAAAIIKDALDDAEKGTQLRIPGFGVFTVSEQLVSRDHPSDEWASFDATHIARHVSFRAYKGLKERLPLRPMSGVIAEFRVEV
jgi:nucleoid DNA-binding protein